MTALRLVSCKLLQKPSVYNHVYVSTLLKQSYCSSQQVGLHPKSFIQRLWNKNCDIFAQRGLGCGPLSAQFRYTFLFRETFSWQKQHTRQFASDRGQQDNTSTNTVIYIVSVLIIMLGMSYAAVPLYKMFCQVTGLGGDPNLGHKVDKVETMEPIRERRINIIFNADHHAAMQWNFKPSQKMITVVPGETALAFYTAKNPTDKPIVGIATYNVLPTQAGLYFNKIQCFCFEEQWLNPHEEVDMPVFFYIDPEFDDDPVLADVDDVVLSYTFFKAEEGMKLPLPGFMKLKSVQSVDKVPS